MARRPAALLAALALFLAAPAAALAQGAGDDQYSDPFGEEQTGGDEGTSGGGDEGASGGGDDEQAPEPAAPEPAAPAPEAAPEATTVQQPPPASGQDQLAYTGAESGLVALAGAVLLVGGVSLRVRLSAPAPRRR